MRCCATIRSRSNRRCGNGAPAGICGSGGAAIICPNKAKQATDLELLYDCIEPSVESREFFLRKGIGWALREYAWTDPDEVQRYVDQNSHRLSGLSRREALKTITRKATRPQRPRPRVKKFFASFLQKRSPSLTFLSTTEPQCALTA
ncbi:DNA alkylation repair protein [Acidiphilium sp.]|uniref:DNA alkylation repair protein n=1 Tax=Acidiphilium TaxID=522 RepID=UPI00338F694E